MPKELWKVRGNALKKVMDEQDIGASELAKRIRTDPHEVKAMVSRINNSRSGYGNLPIPLAQELAKELKVSEMTLIVQYSEKERKAFDLAGEEATVVAGIPRRKVKKGRRKKRVVAKRRMGEIAPPSSLFSVELDGEEIKRIFVDPPARVLLFEGKVYRPISKEEEGNLLTVLLQREHRRLTK